MSDVKKFAAEAVGTFALVLLGCGTAATAGCDAASGSGYLATALAFGLAVVMMAASVGKVSGAHLNPAVSLAKAVDGKLSPKDFVLYVCAQLAGATLGAFALSAFVDPSTGLGANSTANDGIVGSLFVEFLLTFLFVTAVMGATEKASESRQAGFAIGAALTGAHLLGIGHTGTSVNPARSFGPAALVGGAAARDLWVFFVGPLAGALAAALFWRYMRKAFAPDGRDEG